VCVRGVDVVACECVRDGACVRACVCASVSFQGQRPAQTGRLSSVELGTNDCLLKDGLKAAHREAGAPTPSGLERGM
jgi:hypothetical protein